jgi:glycosyltransferase involved in cell wall biosynthesis
VDLRRFQSLDQPVDRAELGFEPEDVVLIFVGRLGPEKNLRFLLRAFAGTVQAYPDASLVIVGDGPEKESLQEQAENSGMSERVRFLGIVPYDQVPRYLSMADAFVTASITEVHPLTVIEAMAAGLPVLGIDSPGVGDTVCDRKTGFLVPEDLASFTASMVRLVADQTQRGQMGEQARLEAEKYTIENTSRLMEERYLQVMALGAGRRRSMRFRFRQWLEELRG